ncbi:hypothetical protein FK530_18975 [Tsukamurella conjunctivitidis]|uniref:Uncharacterized protein n=1 Tax=Tsukamurella conjunctivitidis TaxID=2592068 RepID=A0A5C5RWK3_9ACTN|nr:hypothetical protein [Tsukamurella conjunctivitidis]TWS27406.1 hypothetical protein FK530_18975 [Tsukamurella conjunctivitidis]
MTRLSLRGDGEKYEIRRGTHAVTLKNAADAHRLITDLRRHYDDGQQDRSIVHLEVEPDTNGAILRSGIFYVRVAADDLIRVADALVDLAEGQHDD